MGATAAAVSNARPPGPVEDSRATTSRDSSIRWPRAWTLAGSAPAAPGWARHTNGEPGMPYMDMEGPASPLSGTRHVQRTQPHGPRTAVGRSSGIWSFSWWRSNWAWQRSCLWLWYRRRPQQWRRGGWDERLQVVSAAEGLHAVNHRVRRHGCVWYAAQLFLRFESVLPPITRKHMPLRIVHSSRGYYTDHNLSD
jgi:hypothetical protein